MKCSWWLLRCRLPPEQTQKATLSNGRYYENSYVFILEMREDKVCRIREYMDTLMGYQMVFADDHPGKIVR
ncbi:nuclear transport factor 2 family protein [Paracoccus saliphilus]|uniref:Uncharacterized protein n=1 Tax=Paracoccus saliphilus TaxID=405559 RepID=A0AA46A6D6_9RHOB|nr:hypothetical protein [Paracoccus saliphilus]WCR05623.1 hypothetical protein JHX88_21325 [Paracoccus saliphilus]SIS96438.1 hypothetical protein SAMN05421772_11081 [Paracoccus saliphilus]